MDPNASSSAGFRVEELSKKTAWPKQMDSQSTPHHFPLTNRSASTSQTEPRLLPFPMRS